VIGLFLVRFNQPVAAWDEGDTEVWVVVGDMPPMFFATDDSPTPADALETYCYFAEDWADHVLAGADLSACFPIKAEPTREHGEMLKSRVANIREMFIPIAGAPDRRSQATDTHAANDSRS
jgi:hypothetical protein